MKCNRRPARGPSRRNEWNRTESQRVQALILVEDPEPTGPFGAKGIGEHSLIPTAPAILGAIDHAAGIRMEQLPATPDRVRAAIIAKDRHD